MLKIYLYICMMDSISTAFCREVQDHHSYFVFTDSDRMEKASQRTVDARGGIAEAFGQVSDKQHRNLLIGEWSCALDWNSLRNETSGNVERDRKDFAGRS